MTPTEIAALAHKDPVPNLTLQFGEASQSARKLLDRLTANLRELDLLTEVMAKQHGITLRVDLGPIGNAAAAARRDLERQQSAKFELPKAS